MNRLGIKQIPTERLLQAIDRERLMLERDYANPHRDIDLAENARDKACIELARERGATTVEQVYSFAEHDKESAKNSAARYQWAGFAGVAMMLIPTVTMIAVPQAMQAFGKQVTPILLAGAAIGFPLGLGLIWRIGTFLTRQKEADEQRSTAERWIPRLDQELESEQTLAS